MEVNDNLVRSFVARARQLKAAEGKPFKYRAPKHDRFNLV